MATIEDNKFFQYSDNILLDFETGLVRFYVRPNEAEDQSDFWTPLMFSKESLKDIYNFASVSETPQDAEDILDFIFEANPKYPELIFNH